MWQLVDPLGIGIDAGDVSGGRRVRLGDGEGLRVR
jgi:hypothetical protein